MKILINGLSAIIGGGITYINNIVPRLVNIDNNNQYILLVSIRSKNSILLPAKGNGRLKIVFFAIFNLFHRMIFEQVFIPFIVWRNKVDILFCPANIVSFFSPCKKVLWIQNIDPFVYVAGESIMRRARTKILRYLTELSMKNASIVVFSSDYSKNLILKMTGIDEKKTKRIFLGAEIEKFSKHIVKRSVLDHKYILSVSNISSRKNYEVLIRAYCALTEDIKNNYKLLLVGDVSIDYRQYLINICENNNDANNIIFTGMLSGDDLLDAYSEASIFVLPSLVESFSLPIIEAMATGLPVLASNATCLPEMIGSSGILFDPYNYIDLKQKIEYIINNEALQGELSVKAKEKAKRFSWDNTVAEIDLLFKNISKSEEGC